MKKTAIDVFCHILPVRYYDAVMKCTKHPAHMLKRARKMPVMADISARLEMMDKFEGYQEIPTLVSPPIELFAGPDETPELAMIANDELAQIVKAYPQQFPGFVATLPMNNIEAALAEAERAITSLGACGIQIFTNVNGRPIDHPEFFPLFELMARYDLPIWLHPSRGMNFADYAAEKASKFEIWWALGWPYETSVAMARIVFAGIFDRLPGIKIITHHVGGMIPMMEGRLGPGMDLLGVRTPAEHKELVKTDLRERPLDAFRHFYADTASFGSRPAIECGLAFFGIEKLLFASDMPFDPEQGPGYIRATLRAIDEMNLSPANREAILNGNIKKLLKLA